MGVLNIRPVQRIGSKAIIAISGVSGSGKTYTALQIARGMVSHPSKIGFLDTENKRGSLYSDILDGQFMIGDLYAPFSPRRYRDSIIEFQDSGVEVLVIDSISHEWEGEGGCEDIANAPLENGGKMANWKAAKSEHKKFMNALLQCKMNVIVCIRAREKMDFKNPSKPVSLGIQPICEKNFMYEMTASLMIENEGRSQRFLKMPSFLIPAFGDGKSYIGIQTGKKIIEWVNGSGKEDPEIARIKSEMLMAIDNGVGAIGNIWVSLTEVQKKILFDHKEMCKTSAIEFDRLAKMQEPEEETGSTEDQTWFQLINDCKTLEDLLIYGASEMNEYVAGIYSKRYSELGGIDQ